MNTIEYAHPAELLEGRPVHQFITPPKPREDELLTQGDFSGIHDLGIKSHNDWEVMDESRRNEYISFQFAQFVASFIAHCRKRALDVLGFDMISDNLVCTLANGAGNVVLAVGEHFVRIDVSRKRTIISRSERPKENRWHTFFTSYQIDSCHNEVDDTRDWYQFGIDHGLYRRLMDFSSRGPRVTGEELDATIREHLLPMIERVDRILCDFEESSV